MSTKRSRVHPNYKTQYRVSNWASYDASLVQRGNLNIWMSPDAIKSWNAKPRGRRHRGGQPKYSDFAIETALTLRLLFHLPFRQTEGFLISIFELMGVHLDAPDHTTLSRRSAGLAVGLRARKTTGAIELVIDSSGLAIFGGGEWAAAKHGGEGSERDALWMIEHLLARANTDPVKTLLQTRVLWVQPFVNPDGIVSHQRKNANGVDLNRNFGGRRNGRGSGAPRSQNYPGGAPFSEPETRAVRGFLRGRENLRAYLDLHRSAALIIIPEVDQRGWISKPCVDAFQPLNEAMRGHHSLDSKIRLDDSGFSVDWVWREFGVIAFTWELRPSESPEFAEDVRWQGLLHLLEKAGSYGRYSTLRLATFNVCLDRRKAGQLVAELRRRDSAQAKAVAEILQRVRPDVVLLNEMDWDEKGEAVQLLRSNYLRRSQSGARPIDYPHVYHAPSNTGVDSGFDLDNDGRKGEAADALGFGRFPGQYGMVLLSRYPIDAERSRTFREFRWKDMPGAMLPEGWFSKEEIEAVRLSSKNHWDVVVQVHGVPVHVLCAHPTPPVFDGVEDRNGRRNHDEIRFFADYLVPERSRYIVDDRGKGGGLATGEHFVILGDYNADPHDGDSTRHAISQLLDHPAVNAGSTPESKGAVEAADRAGDANSKHTGDPACDTGDFGARVGNLRLDYVLPSRRLRIVQSGVFWPTAEDPLFRLVGDGRTIVSSDHRLVFCEVELRRR